MTAPPEFPDDPSHASPEGQASPEEEEELRRMRQAILSRSDRKWWQLLSRKALFRAFWLLLLLLAIVWLQRNAGRMVGSVEQSLSPEVTPATLPTN